MVSDGLITLETVAVVQYATGHSQGPLEQPLGNIMRREVVTVRPETPVAELVTLLLERGVRSQPVVDTDGALLGILIDGDLLQWASLASRIGLQPVLAEQGPNQQLATLRQSSATAADVISGPVITVRAGDNLRAVIRKMVRHNLKRLPVVDDGDYQQAQTETDVEAPMVGRTVAELMHAEVPMVGPAARWRSCRALEQS